VTVDGHQAFEGILPAFTQKSWQGSKAILFRTGNAGGVRLTLNGKKLQQIGPSGHIAQKKFSAPP
jgi:cytoskeleton protein RodZ